MDYVIKKEIFSYYLEQKKEDYDKNLHYLRHQLSLYGDYTKDEIWSILREFEEIEKGICTNPDPDCYEIYMEYNNAPHIRNLKDAGLSQEELADKIYVSRSAIARWENGLGTPSEANMLELSKFFDVKLEEFGIEAKKEEPKSYNKFFLPLLITSITFFLLSIGLFITTICLSVNSKKESSTSNMKEVIEQIYAKKVSVNGMNMDIFTYTLPEKEKSTTIQVKPTVSKKDLLVANTTSKASSYTLSFLEEPSNVRAYYCEVDSEYNPIYTSLNSYREKSEWYNRTYLDAEVSNNIVTFSYDTAMACLVLEISYSDVVIEYYILVK